MVQALCGLDADVDVTSTTRQTTKNSKTLEDGYPDENDELFSGEDLEGEDWPDTDELDSFNLNEQSEDGNESAEEEHIWIMTTV